MNKSLPKNAKAVIIGGGVAGCKDKPIEPEEVESIYKENFSKNYWPDEFIKVKKFKKTISQKIKI